jgi:hypothetical protein
VAADGPRFTKLGKNIFYPVREIQHWTELNVLDRVRESLPAEVPMTRYKTGENVSGTIDATVPPYGDPSSADEIEQTLAALIEPPSRPST